MATVLLGLSNPVERVAGDEDVVGPPILVHDDVDSLSTVHPLPSGTVAADGYYEWQKLDGKKQPWYVRLKDGKLFAFAGLWERWAPRDGEAVESCTILTTDANELNRPIHNRMPVIVDLTGFGQWLAPEAKPDVVKGLLHPYPSEKMEEYPVSTFVNNVRNKGPQCVEPLA